MINWLSTVWALLASMPCSVLYYLGTQGSNFLCRGCQCQATGFRRWRLVTHRSIGNTTPPRLLLLLLSSISSWVYLPSTCHLYPTALPCNLRKTASFLSSLCLSRACLGKISIFICKWRKKCRFAHRTSRSIYRRSHLPHMQYICSTIYHTPTRPDQTRPLSLLVGRSSGVCLGNPKLSAWYLPLIYTRQRLARQCQALCYYWVARELHGYGNATFCAILY